jgi:hypothetical protein
MEPFQFGIGHPDSDLIDGVAPRRIAGPGFLHGAVYAFSALLFLRLAKAV